MHSLAREALRQRLAALPREEQQALHGRAAEWLAEHGLLGRRRAARAGRGPGRQQAYELAERSLYESLMTQGRQGRCWSGWRACRREELDRRPRLLLAAAWSLATERAPRGGRAAGRAHPGAARRGRRAALRMRADPQRRGDLRRRPGPLRRAARSLGRGAAAAATRCCCRSTPTARPSARCSRASRRWRGCASSRRRAAPASPAALTWTAGATSSSP